MTLSRRWVSKPESTCAGFGQDQTPFGSVGSRNRFIASGAMENQEEDGGGQQV